MNALRNKIASQTTEMLLEIARQLGDKLGTEEIAVCTLVESELERRLPEAEFLAFMAEQEAALA